MKKKVSVKYIDDFERDYPYMKCEVDGDGVEFIVINGFDFVEWVSNNVFNAEFLVQMGMLA